MWVVERHRVWYDCDKAETQILCHVVYMTQTYDSAYKRLQYESKKPILIDGPGTPYWAMYYWDESKPMPLNVQFVATREFAPFVQKIMTSDKTDEERLNKPLNKPVPSPA